MTEALFGQLASTGTVGVLLVLALFALRAKDRELKAEMNARIEDAIKFNTLAMSLQREVIQAVNDLGKMLDILVEKQHGEERTMQVRPRGGGGASR